MADMAEFSLPVDSKILGFHEKIPYIRYTNRPAISVILSIESCMFWEHILSHSHLSNYPSSTKKWHSTACPSLPESWNTQRGLHESVAPDQEKHQGPFNHDHHEPLISID